MTITSSSSGENGYQNLADCRWFIVAPPGSVVQLRFTSFDLESYPECRYDYVEIFDNIVINDSNARAIGKYCGNEAPPIILSTTRALTIHFKSDDSVTGDGFMATYDFIDGKNCKCFEIANFLRLETHNAFNCFNFQCVVVVFTH